MVYQKTQGHPRTVLPAGAESSATSRRMHRLLAAALLAWTLASPGVQARPPADTPLSEPLPTPQLSDPAAPPAPEEDKPAVALQPPNKLPADNKLPAEAAPKDGELPQPKLAPRGPLSGLAESRNALGSTPRPTEEDYREQNQFIQGVIDPRFTLDVIEGRTRIILLKETPAKIQVADDNIIGHNLLEPKQLIIQGKSAGTTVMTFWFADPNDKNKDKILSYLVRVLPDPERRLRLEAQYKALEKEIHKQFPDSLIHINLVGDKVVVSGEAKDVQQATAILRLIRGSVAPDTARLPVSNLNVNVNAGDLLNPAGTPGLDSFLTAGGGNIINLIRIPGEQQVMLRVTVAEVNRTAARSIGVNFNIFNHNGEVFGQQTGGLIVGGSVLTQNQTNTGGVLANVPVILDNGRIPIAISALKTLGYARSLAEPNLTALNGRTASFQAGGSFPVPVVGGFGGGGANPGLQGVQFIPYGVLLNFTPVITDRDRVRLIVQANVSTRDTSTGAQIGTAAVSGLTTRNFNTTVEMREGQTLAVAGLIQTNIASQTNRLPLFGDIPILNRFAGYDKVQSGEQELVILITPELVAPLEKKEVAKVPGSDLFEPSDLQFYLFGKLENNRSMDYRSQAMNDIHRMIRYKHAEQLYIFGPVGHNDDPNYPFDPYDRYGREIRPMPGPMPPRRLPGGGGLSPGGPAEGPTNAPATPLPDVPEPEDAKTPSSGKGKGLTP